MSPKPTHFPREGPSYSEPRLKAGALNLPAKATALDHLRRRWTHGCPCRRWVSEFEAFRACSMAALPRQPQGIHATVRLYFQAEDFSSAIHSFRPWRTTWHFCASGPHQHHYHHHHHHHQPHVLCCRQSCYLNPKPQTPTARSPKP